MKILQNLKRNKNFVNLHKSCSFLDLCKQMPYKNIRFVCNTEPILPILWRMDNKMLEIDKIEILFDCSSLDQPSPFPAVQKFQLKC